MVILLFDEEESDDWGYDAEWRFLDAAQREYFGGFRHTDGLRGRTNGSSLFARGNAFAQIAWGNFPFGKPQTTAQRAELYDEIELLAAKSGLKPISVSRRMGVFQDYVQFRDKRR